MESLKNIGYSLLINKFVRSSKGDSNKGVEKDTQNESECLEVASTLLQTVKVEQFLKDFLLSLECKR